MDRGTVARWRLANWMRLFIGVAIRRPNRAISIAFWYASGRRVRARNRLHEAATALLPPYKTWMMITEEAEFKKYGARTKATYATFTIVVLAQTGANPERVKDTTDSVLAQSCMDWDLVILAYTDTKIPDATLSQCTLIKLEKIDVDQRFLDIAIREARGDFIIFVKPGTILSPDALARYADVIRENPSVTALFSDEDRLDVSGRRVDPWFKPQWNSELFLSQDYISSSCAISTSAARLVEPIERDISGCAIYGLLVGMSSADNFAIEHVPHVLSHLPSHENVCSAAVRCRSIEYWFPEAKATAGPFGTVSVQWPLPVNQPQITIIIPTRDAIEILKSCVTSVLEKTEYKNFDILIMDNGSVNPETHIWFAEIKSDPRISIIRHDYPYNYSEINNSGVALAKGEYVCLLNNDTEIIDGSWLTELLRYAARPDVGAVGPKLLYGDHTIQHAGVVIGLGNAAGHAHRGLPNSERGYFAFAHSAHFSSAVTGACLLVQKNKFNLVGGLDDKFLPIAYNDVDLCLKFQRAGWKNVYAPQAVLLHHESKTRGADISPENIERYLGELSVLQERWSTIGFVDPMHHPALDRSSERYQIRL